MYGWKQDFEASIRQGSRVQVSLVNGINGEGRTVAGKLASRSGASVTIEPEEQGRMEIPWCNICCITEAS